MQPGASGIQSQTGQAQTTNTSLNQTGGVQTNNGNQSYLNQAGLKPLGVVSDPSQANPQVVAQPSGNLKTEIDPQASQKNSTNPLKWVALITFIVAVAGFVYLWRAPRKVHTPEQAAEEETIITPLEAAETLKELNKKPPKAKKDKRSRKQRRKKS